MAIPTFSAGQYPTAAALNTAFASPFPVGIDAWTVYVPTLTQSTTVTKTVSVARYFKVGRWCWVELNLACTGAGTANAEVDVGLPLTATSYGAGFTALGNGGIFDASAGIFYNGGVIIATTTAVRISINGSTDYAGRTGGGFAVALAASDQITMGFGYQTAS